MKYPLLAITIALASAVSANAAFVSNASLGFAPWLANGMSAPGQLQLAPSGFVNTGTGGLFSGMSLEFGLFKMDTTLITGIGSSSTPVSITDFFVFSEAPGPLASFGYTGGTTTARFHFDLESLTQTHSGNSSFYAYSGTGTLRDITGAYSPSPANFTMSGSIFSGGSSGAWNYSGTMAAQLTAVPEPSTYLAGISALGMLCLFGRRNRK